MLVPFELHVEVPPADQFTVRNTGAAAAAPADHAVVDTELIRCNTEFERRHFKQRAPCLGGGITQRRTSEPDAGRARGAALIDRLFGMALHHADTIRGEIEFFGDHHDPADFSALPHVDLAYPADHAAVLIDADVTGELVGFEAETRSLGASGIGLLREAGQQNCDREGAAAAEKFTTIHINSHVGLLRPVLRV